MTDLSTGFAVDIGNSGLRLSQLDLTNGRVGPSLRINWRHASDGHAPRSLSGPSDGGDGGLQSTTRGVGDRYPPGSSDWLPEIEGWLARLAADASGRKSPLPLRWFVSSVRGDALAMLTSFVESRRGDELRVLTYRDVPLAVDVDHPQRLGIDRLLASFAAAATTRLRPLLVIQAGSALTVDLVVRRADESDAFAGGAILPGVPMMLRLLGQAADMLPEIDAEDLTELPPLPGKNTEAAMLCGTASALLGGVQHVVARYRAAYGESLPVVISGGDGMRVSPYIPPPVSVHADLVQQGILLLAQRNPS